MCAGNGSVVVAKRKAKIEPGKARNDPKKAQEDRSSQRRVGKILAPVL